MEVNSRNSAPNRRQRKQKPVQQRANRKCARYMRYSYCNSFSVLFPVVKHPYDGKRYRQQLQSENFVVNYLKKVKKAHLIYP